MSIKTFFKWGTGIPKSILKLGQGTLKHMITVKLKVENRTMHICKFPLY